MSEDMEKIKIEYLPITSIVPYPNNSKNHKLRWIQSSIEAFDFDQPIVVDKDMVIIKGHGRYEAAKNLNYEYVPVIIRKDLNKDQAAMSRIADNRTSQGGGFDFGRLGTELDFLKKAYTPQFMESIGLNSTYLKKGAKENLNIDLGDDQEIEIDDFNPDKRPYVPEKIILSIVIDSETNATWQDFKRDCGKKTDSLAFIQLLENWNHD